MKYTELTSRKNKTVTDIAELSKSKRRRDVSGTFPIEGIKLFDEAIISGMEICSVFFTEKAMSLYSDRFESLNNAELYLVTDEVYEKLSDESAPQGILAVVKKPEPCIFDDKSAKNGSFVLLEDIQNPLNIGAILRCSYSLGFEKVVFSRGCADIYSPKCARAAMGSLFRIKPYFADDLTNIAKILGNVGNRVFCTSLNERSVKLGNFEFMKSDSFVIGNEGHGASKALMEECSHSLFIPMNTGAESLNAATAAAIVMWEMRKCFLCNK